MSSPASRLQLRGSKAMAHLPVPGIAASEAASESTPPLLELDLSLAFLMGALEDEFNRTTAINVGEPRQVSSEQTHTAT